MNKYVWVLRRQWRDKEGNNDNFIIGVFKKRALAKEKLIEYVKKLSSINFDIENVEDRRDYICFHTFDLKDKTIDDSFWIFAERYLVEEN